jgi:hypothetical protein
VYRSEESIIEHFLHFGAGSRQLQPTVGPTGEFGSDGSLGFLSPFSEKMKDCQCREHFKKQPGRCFHRNYFGTHLCIILGLNTDIRLID